MPRASVADHLPREVLARPDFARACAGHDLGEVLRLAKRWGGAGFSASHLARRCDLTVSRVQDYASGRIQAQQLSVFERVADGLHIPGFMFNIGPRPWELDESRATPPGAGNIERLPTEPQCGFPDQISTDFLWAPERAQILFIEDVRACIDQLVSVDNRFGGAEISHLSEIVFDAVRERLGSCDYEPSVKKDLVAAAGELAEVAGWLAYDADRQDAVRRMNHEALHFTRLAGDRSMELLTLQNASMHAGFLNRPGEALDIADMVLEGDQYRLTPRLRALFLTRKSRALAQLGADSALTLFDEIRSLFLDGTCDHDPPWAWWIDDRELSWHEAMCRRNLGEGRAALAWFERSVESTQAEEVWSQYLHRGYLLGAQVSLRSWAAVEQNLVDLQPLASEVASTRTVRLISAALTELHRPELCVPRQLRERVDWFERRLKPRMEPRGI